MVVGGSSIQQKTLRPKQQEASEASEQGGGRARVFCSCMWMLTAIDPVHRYRHSDAGVFLATG